MAKFTKGNKVKIVNTDTVWDDKLGTVIEEANEEIYSENGDDLTEVLVKVAFKSKDEVKSIIQRFNRGNLELVPEENLNEEKNMENKKFNTNTIWEELNNTDEETTENNSDIVNESYIDIKDDFIEPYVTAEDCEGKKCGTWTFINRIMAAEDCDEVAVTQCAAKHGYKLYWIEAGEYNKTVIAAKNIKKEDIAEDFANYLLGNARIEEIK